VGDEGEAVRSLTIGEVLNHLKEEFEDITISKIRFLESEGLISPDRTESGYRQFSDDDLERLRYVLRTQRDRYLPLKVIKEELDRLDAGEEIAPPPPPPPPTAARSEHGDLLEAADPVDEHLGVEEVCARTGLDAAQVRALREHGVLEGDDRFDADDVAVAQTAAELIELGLEPRHLRMYRQFSDRESALYEQLVTPLMKQRNPDSRRRAAEQARDLARSGRDLHTRLLARELRRIVGQ
jgi:DNA-binding transcriptional MerR regulator